MRSLAALIELAEMLIPRVTIIRPMAAKAAAARPPEDPEAIQRLMMSIGFQSTSPYAVSAAAAVKMPSRPTTVKIQGMTIACTFTALGLLAYLAKSAMFRPRVA